MRSFVLLVVSLVSACRITSSAAEASLPAEGRIYRVECNYELKNCLAEAERRCRRGYEQITRQNCPRCGLKVPPTPDRPPLVTRPGYHGVIYYRCL